MSNPFITEPALPAPAPEKEEGMGESDPVMGTDEVVFGPLQTASPVPSTPSGLVARREVFTTPSAWIVGLHSASGASSLSRLIADSEESPANFGVPHWPIPGNGVAPAPVILVARTNWIGLQAADSITVHWGAHHLQGCCPLLGLVLVADAPSPAPELRATTRALLHRVPHGWHLPWQEAWRFLPEEERPLSGPVSKRVIRNLGKCVSAQSRTTK